MAVHPRHQRLQPAGRHFNVGVDEHIILRFDTLQRPVIPACKAVIPVQDDERHLREFRLHHCHRAVGGGIIGHNHLCIKFFTGFNEPRQELPQVVLGVVIEYDD